MTNSKTCLLRSLCWAVTYLLEPITTDSQSHFLHFITDVYYTSFGWPLACYVQNLIKFSMAVNDRFYRTTKLLSAGNLMNSLLSGYHPELPMTQSGRRVAMMLQRGCRPFRCRTLVAWTGTTSYMQLQRLLQVKNKSNLQHTQYMCSRFETFCCVRRIFLRLIVLVAYDF